MLQGPLRLLLLPMNALLLLLNRRELHPSEIYSLSVRAASCCRYHTRHDAAAASSSVVFNVCPRVCRRATVSFTCYYQVLQEKDAMVVRSADELVAVKSQAKAAGLKFSERAKAEKLALQTEIKQLQVTPTMPSLTCPLAHAIFVYRTLWLLATKSCELHWAQESQKEARLLGRK
jgi:hypothetical protein